MWLRSSRGNLFNMDHARGVLAWSTGSDYVVALLVGKDEHIALTDAMTKKQCREILADIHKAMLAGQQVFDLPNVSREE